MNVPSLSDTFIAELAALKIGSVIKNKPPTAVGSVPVKVKIRSTGLFVLNNPPDTKRPPVALAEIVWPDTGTFNGLE